jgi:hypothetical protein
LIKINENERNTNGYVHVSEVKDGPIDRFGYAYSDKINNALSRMDDSVKKVPEGAGENEHESVAHESVRSAKFAEINDDDENCENRKNEKKRIKRKPWYKMLRIKAEQCAFIVNKYKLQILSDNTYWLPVVQKIFDPLLRKKIQEKTYYGHRNKKRPLRFCRLVVHYRLHYNLSLLHTHAGVNDF